MKVYEGKLIGNGHKYGIIIGRFNEFIGSKLKEGAVDTLVRHGVDLEDIDLMWIPGAFEMPLAAKKMAQTGRYDGIICLGAIIRGETPHFDFVASENAKGIASVMLEESIPVGYGVLTTENLEQAIHRAGTKAGNKGADAALATLESVNVLKELL
jgi:6,7-dimethyl-8-ribityllumazine synthase